MSKPLPPVSVLCRRQAPDAQFNAAAPGSHSLRHSDHNTRHFNLRYWRRSLTIVSLAAAWLVALPCALVAQANFGAQPIGASATATVTVTARAAGQINSIAILTNGNSGLDFAAGSGAGTCASGLSLSVGSTCTQSVGFTPAYPGVRLGAVVLLDSGNNVLGVNYLSGSGTGGLGLLLPGNITTFAGNGDWKSVGDGEPATEGDLFLPSALALDGIGNLYIADSNHNRIRMVCAGTATTIAGTSCPGAGIITTIAGVQGTSGYAGDGGPASATTVAMNTPSGLTIDGAGDLYIADTGNNVIREISASTGKINTIAGNGNQGPTGDGGPALSAEFDQPDGVAFDVNGNLYIADTQNNRIRALCAGSGTLLGVACPAPGDIITVAGNGNAGSTGDSGQAVAANLNGPYTIALDAAGDLFIADTSNSRVRAVCASASSTIFGTACTAAGVISTVTGDGTKNFSGDGGPAASAELDSPSGLVVDPAGNLYIADSQNLRVRKINVSTGIINTIAGDGSAQFGGDGGPATAAGLYGPYGLALDGNGNLYIAEYLDNRVREVQSNLAIVTVKNPVRQGFTSPPTPITVENDGNAPLDLTTLAAGTNTAMDPATTTCTNSDTLAIVATCVVGAEFAPAATPPLTQPSQPETGNIDVNDDVVPGVTGSNSPLVITVNGTATLVNPTTITVTPAPNPSVFSQSVTFTATVAPTSGSGTPTGTVAFFDGATQLVTGVAMTGGVATYSISTLTVGTHQITATYSGDNNNQQSTSNPITQTVNEGTATALTPSANPSGVGASVTFTATVTAPNGGGVTPDGTVTFLDGAATLTTVPLGAGGTAQYSTSTLTQGQHSITAVYSGDAAKFVNGSTSSVLTQAVLASSTIVLTPSLNPSTYGASVTFTATITASGTVTATGTVNFLDGATQIGTGALNGSGVATAAVSNLAVGNHTITATYAGDTNVGPGTSNAVPQVVNPAGTGTTVTAQPQPGIAGAPVTITATVAETNGGTATLTGTVTFSNAGTSIGSAPVGAGGVAAITPILTPPGNYSIVATYSGDNNDNGSASAPFPYQVIQATTQVALTTSGSPAQVLSNVVFKAVVTGNGATPGGSVVFTVDGASAGTVPLDPTGTATLTDSTMAVGNHSVVAAYSGDVNDASANSSPLAQVITAIPTVTSLGASSTTGANPQTILVAVTQSTGGGPVPTGTMTFMNGSTAIGSATLDPTGVATLVPDLPTGNYNIVASYGGDSNHSPSQSQPVPINGSPAGFSISVNPTKLSLATGQNGTVTVTVAAESGFTDTIGMGCLSVPAAVNCHFSSNTVNLTSGGQSQTVQLTIDTNNPLGGGSSASIASPGRRGISLAGLFLPTGLLFGIVFWRFRRRHAAFFAAALVLLLASAVAVTGCSGGFSQVTAAPGTYTIQVGGIGANSNTSHYQNVTLTITQ